MASQQAVLWVHYIPILTTLIAVAFSASLFRRYFQRRAPHLLWWALGVAFYGLGTALEASITLFGNSVGLTKAWYIAGAILGGYPLAQGSLYLSYSRRFANRATAISLPFALVASLLVVLSPAALEHLEPHRPGGAVLAWHFVRLLTPFINAYAAFFLIGGAITSAWRFWRRGDAGHRAAGNAFIATGAFLPGVGGSMAKAGVVEALYVGEFIGLILIWTGDRVCGWRRGEPAVVHATLTRGRPSMRPSTYLGLVLAALVARPVLAADIVGVATDATGGALPAARISVVNTSSGQQFHVTADAAGSFEVKGLPAGTYRVVVSFDGFVDQARTVTLASERERLTVHVRLELDAVRESVTVTATRNERDVRLVPLRTDSVARDTLESRVPLSTGAALVQAPSVVPVSSGPMQERPRLRGLDSTRLLVLVDGERLNNARTATDRSGTEVSLVDLNSVERIEIVGGSGSVLYGTDALAGTINIITSQPRLTDSLKLTYGFDGFYSSNEGGKRGTGTFGASDRRYAFQVQATLEDYGNYRAGGAAAEDTRAFFDQGVLKQADTIDDNFGFAFNAFPDPFNAPFVRTSSLVPRSAARGSSINATGLFAIDDRQTVQVKYLRRRVENVGFPDFEPPVFFQRVSLPSNNLDRISARYEAQRLAPWLASVKVATYFQDQNRVLHNEFPVQFPVPSPRFFPINVYRLDLVTDTGQHVQTPGFDAQATMVFARAHTVTAGAMVYRDRSRDSRTSVSQMSLIGSVGLGLRGPEATVLSAPVPVGPPSTTHPVRVPDASFSDVGVFVQDEWEISRTWRFVTGIRLDRYSVNTEPTSGYNVDSVVAGAQPPIDPATLPSAGGEGITRRAFTGDVGVVYRPVDRVSLLARYGRSYRHPNLEELLFSGPATVGAIAPNLTVRPETGHNVDVGIKVQASRYSAALSYYNNTYDGFISTEIVAITPTGPLSQAVNFTNVRIQGIEAAGDLPIVTRRGVVTLFGNAAWTHGEVLSGANPLTGESLAGTPQDNISPFKMFAGVRFSDARDRFWVEYDARVQAKVTRVAPTLLESPFLIAQDLLSLEGFTVQRLAWGLNVRGQGGRLGLVFAVENLADTFYREQFQFAPARGRSFTIGMNVRGF